jgi:hypothetical protein
MELLKHLKLVCGLLGRAVALQSRSAIPCFSIATIEESQHSGPTFK